MNNCQTGLHGQKGKLDNNSQQRNIHEELILLPLRKSLNK